MTPDEVKKLLPDYILNLLDEKQNQEVKTYLDQSPTLQREEKKLRNYFASLQALESYKASPGFLVEVNRRLESGPSWFQRILKSLFFPFHVKIPMELAGLTLSIVLVILLLDPFNPKNIPPLTVEKKSDETIDFVTSAPEPKSKSSSEIVTEPVVEAPAKEIIKPKKSLAANRVKKKSISPKPASPVLKKKSRVRRKSELIATMPTQGEQSERMKKAATSPEPGTGGAQVAAESAITDSERKARSNQITAGQSKIYSAETEKKEKPESLGMAVSKDKSKSITFSESRNELTSAQPMRNLDVFDASDEELNELEDTEEMLPLAVDQVHPAPESKPVTLEQLTFLIHPSKSGEQNNKEKSDLKALRKKSAKASKPVGTETEMKTSPRQGKIEQSQTSEAPSDFFFQVEKQIINGGGTIVTKKKRGMRDKKREYLIQMKRKNFGQFKLGMEKLGVFPRDPDLSQISPDELLQFKLLVVIK